MVRRSRSWLIGWSVRVVASRSYCLLLHYRAGPGATFARFWRRAMTSSSWSRPTTQNGVSCPSTPASLRCCLVARRLSDNETPTRRGVFVNLSRAAYRETDALALVNAVNAAVSAPLHRSDGPPVGGSPLFVGGERWGEVINGPVGPEPWKASRWKRALTSQFAAALERGELWADDGAHVVGRIPVTPMRSVCHVGPQDRQIRGSLGVFDAYHGPYGEARLPAVGNLGSPNWSQSQFPAIWSLEIIGPSKFARGTQRLASPKARP